MIKEEVKGVFPKASRVCRVALRPRLQTTTFKPRGEAHSVSRVCHHSMSKTRVVSWHPGKLLRPSRNNFLLIVLGISCASTKFQQDMAPTFGRWGRSENANRNALKPCWCEKRRIRPEPLGSQGLAVTGLRFR